MFSLLLAAARRGSLTLFPHPDLSSYARVQYRRYFGKS